MNDIEYYKCLSNDYAIFSKGNIYPKVNISKYLANHPDNWQQVYVSDEPIINNNGYPKFELVSNTEGRFTNDYVTRLVLYANDNVTIAVTDYVSLSDKEKALRSFNEVTVWKKHKSFDINRSIMYNIDKLKTCISDKSINVDKIFEIIDKIKTTLQD